MPDINLTHRAQQSIADRVNENIRVRVPRQPMSVGDLYTAQEELAAFHQLVNIVTNANLIHKVQHCARFLFPWQEA